MQAFNQSVVSATLDHQNLADTKVYACNNKLKLNDLLFPPPLKIILWLTVIFSTHGCVCVCAHAHAFFFLRVGENLEFHGRSNVNKKINYFILEEFEQNTFQSVRSTDVNCIPST